MTETQAPAVSREEAERIGTGMPVDPTGAGGTSPQAGDVRDQQELAGPEDAARPAHHLPDLPYRRLAGLAITGIGALIVVFLVYLIVFTPLTAARDQERLTQTLVGQPLSVYSLVAGRTPAEGSAVAVLEIPAIHLHQVVVEGTSGADLMNGPGHMPGTAIPGTVGNAVIAARRVTFGAPFGPLAQLRHGDRIRVVDGVGSFTYKVTTVFTVTSGQRDVVTPTTDDRITLISSNSSLVTSGRLAVVGKLVGTPIAVPGATLTLPAYELGLAGDPAAAGLTILWSLLTLVVLVGAGIVAWRWRRPALVYLLAAPVVIACGLFACESLARALPATY